MHLLPVGPHTRRRSPTRMRPWGALACSILPTSPQQASHQNCPFLKKNAFFYALSKFDCFLLNNPNYLTPNLL